MSWRGWVGLAFAAVSLALIFADDVAHAALYLACASIWFLGDMKARAK